MSKDKHPITDALLDQLLAIVVWKIPFREKTTIASSILVFPL